MTREEFKKALVMERIKEGSISEAVLRGGKRMLWVVLQTRQGMRLESVGKDWGEVLSKLPSWIKREG